MADILSGGPDRLRRPVRALIALGVVAVSVVVVVAVADHRRAAHRPGAAPTSPAVPGTSTGGRSEPVPSAEPCQPVGWGQHPAVVDPPAGLVVDGAARALGGGLERCDRTAGAGPWSVVVRRDGGSLGRNGAVVTFPVGEPAAGHPVDIDRTPGRAQDGLVGWALAGAYARIRGDLGEAELVALAARTTVVAGRPEVAAPPGYAVVSAGPYRAPAVREIRYGTVALGEQAALGDGLTFAGLTSGGGFEDQLYAVRAAGAGPVHGEPAVVSSQLGGSATVAWELTPGLVGYVGYSGSAPDEAATAALRRLAGRTRALTVREWRATNPQTVDQLNDPD